MREVTGVDKLRQLNQNITVTEHSMSDVLAESSHLKQNPHKKVDSDEQVQKQMMHDHKNKSHQNKHQHQHEDGRSCSHDHKKGNKQRGNPLIIVYTLFTIFSCLYLQQHYMRQYLPNDSTYKDLIMVISKCDVVMCLIFYIVTICTSNKFPLMKSLPLSLHLIPDYDKAYSLVNKPCQKCRYYKMPRVSHCSTCGSCIGKLDHHCVWTQNCIGYRNHKTFYLFTMFMFFGVVIFWYCTYHTVGSLYGSCKFFSVFEFYIYLWWAMTCFSAGAVGMMIAGLFVSHSFMILTNYTTLDGIKKKKMCHLPFCEWRNYFLNDQNVNLFDRGEIQNFKEFFGTNILTFFSPVSRQLNNQFIIQKMNPFPTRYKLLQFSGELSEELDRQEELNRIVKDSKISYKGKKFIIKDDIIEIN